MKPTIAIIGRPNVGKSTLFNRILKRRHAVVAEESGVTRDRHFAEAEWTGHYFMLIDTGGITEFPEHLMEAEIRRQAEMAINQADRIIFLVDVQAGITPDDEAVADVLRRCGKQVILAGNKADNQNQEMLTHEFLRLGLGNPMPVSAMRGRGVGDLLDEVVGDLPVANEENEDDSVKIAIIGKPNVGKSSLVNAFLNEERQIVHDVPGTTRDSIDSKIKFFGKDITLIDTAGLRRPSRVKEEIEFFSNIRTSKALSRCDIAIVMIEASENITNQAARVINEAVERGKGIIILANKWDLMEKETGTYEQFRDELYFRIPNMTYIPLLTISAASKQRIHQRLKLAMEVMTNTQLRIQTSELNEYMLGIINKTPPPTVENKYIKIKYISQVSIQPTVITFHCNYPDLIGEQYKRFLERKIREKYKFTGIPLVIRFLQK